MTKDAISNSPETQPPQSLPSLARGEGVIKSYVKHLTDGAGVYRMLDIKGKVLYVGKAKSLSKRVASYTRGQGQSLRIQRMIAATYSMEFMLTQNEVEALLLENNLIKHYRPPYNVLLRDDKTHLELFISNDHEFPQITRHRGARRKKGQYFGPYAGANYVHQTMNLLERLFLLRNCSDSVFENRKRPCLQYQIKRCSAPCVGYIDAASYQENIKRAVDFLRGQSQSLTGVLETEMQQAASDRDYEKAASLRDRIRALMHLKTDQDVNGKIEGDADIIALAELNGQMAVQVVFYRGGRHNGNQVYYPKHERNMDAEAFLEAFMGQLYQTISPPAQILLSHPVAGDGLLESALGEVAGHKVHLKQVKRGDKFQMVMAAEQNAKAALARKAAGDHIRREHLNQLGALVGLNHNIERVEVYDNSHLSGTNPIGAMIVAGAAGFDKPSYRSFNIRKDMDAKTAKSIAVQDRVTSDDDYLMMREVMTRRFSRLINDYKRDQLDQNNSKSALPPIPDIVMLDGGLGQLSAATDALNALSLPENLPNPPKLIAVAKGVDRNAGREKLFIPGQPPLELPFDSPLLYFIQRLRDEAHRFAIGTQRKRRKQGNFENPLDQIEGVGSVIKKRLMLHFGSAREVAGAGIKDLKLIPGVSTALAQKIYDFFHPNQ